MRILKRKLVSRICPICKLESLVRADSVGKLCSPCRARENHKIRKPKNISGLKFGLLKVLSFDHINKHAHWKCKCDCGNECVIAGCRLRNEQTRSCGCLTKTQNGLSTSGSYHSWDSMIQRCSDERLPHFKRYGGKGISVCERWKKFENFYEDMGERPPGLTLDRIDPLKNYTPENCRWATVKEQANNTSSNHKITFNGVTKNLTQWAEEYNIHWSTLRKRIIDLKWDINKALTQPVGQYASKKR